MCRNIRPLNNFEPPATVEKVNDALAAERREKVMQTIDGKLVEAMLALDEAQADPTLRNKVLKPLQDLKLRLAGLSSIPHIQDTQLRSAELLDEVMDELALAAKAKVRVLPPLPPIAPQPGQPQPVTPPIPAPAVKPQKNVKVIRVTDLGGKTYLESEADIDECLRKLKGELMAAIQAGQKARLQ